MKTPRIVFALSAGLLLFKSSLPATPGDLAWSLPLDDLIYSSVAVDPNRAVLYVGTVRDEPIPGSAETNPAGSVFAISMANPLPTVLWEFQTDDWVDSTPTLGADGTLFVGSWDGNLYAIDTASGELRWQYPTDGIIVASPALDDAGNIIFPSSDGFLYSLTPDGNLRWEVLIGNEMDSSPAIDNVGNSYLGTLGGELVSISSAGALRWVFQTDTVEGLDPRILASPAVTAEGDLVFGAGNGYFYRLDSDGNLIWKTNFPEEVDSSPVVDPAGNLHFGVRSGELYQLDPLGIERWAAPLGDIFFSSPAIDAEGRIYAVSFAGNGRSAVTCHAPDGDVLWSAEIPAIVDASPALTPNGLLVVGAYDGTLYAFRTGSVLQPQGWPQFGRGLQRRQNANQDPTPDSLNRFFGYPLELGSGWVVADWLGLTFSPDWPWLFPAEWSWVYPGGPGGSSLWLFNPQLGWIWTGQGSFPYLFQNQTGHWLYLHRQAGKTPWYYRFSDAPGWFQTEP